MVNSPLIRPYFLGGWHRGGVPLDSHEFFHSDPVKLAFMTSHEHWNQPVFFRKKNRAHHFTHTHMIHVWYIYLHLVDFYGKCR